jgi:Rne/Rng family ribonuclease
MNKELYVSSTPHETKVGLVEDDLLAEIYLERENEYTLAGSIYKGRVTRVLPGMQSAFVDIGLERDAFLYVSDFMELEEHDEDLTDVVPANRGVQDLRQQPVQAAPSQEAQAYVEGDGQAGDEGESAADDVAEPGEHDLQEHEPGNQLAAPAGAAPESANSGDAQGRERGGFRGRRRRRGGRRDGRGDGRSDVRGDGRNEGRTDARSEVRDGRDRGPERGAEPRFSEPRFSRPAQESAPQRPQESGRTQSFGPPAGYQPILLPGESISKYQRFAQQPPAKQSNPQESIAVSAPASVAAPASPLAATFPEDEPFFAGEAAAAEPLHEEHHNDSRAVEAVEEEHLNAASAAADWNSEFRRPETAGAERSAAPSSEAPAAYTETAAQEALGQADGFAGEHVDERVEHAVVASAAEPPAPVFAAPGTMEEETIEEEEAEAARYQESSDEGYEEFEEETRAVGQPFEAANPAVSAARETVSEIHRTSLTEAGGQATVEGAAAEGEEDSEELELEEAQAQAEALLDAEARGNSTVDARVEVRAPASTAGYTQRPERTDRPGNDRPGSDRPGSDRRPGGPPRGRRGPRRFRRRESAPVPLISDLLKEGQEILVQIAKEPIGKKGARITSHIALPGRFLVYMPTVNHTGVSRKIASEEERQRLKRIILSERENGHGGFIVRTAAQNAGEDELRADIRFLKGLWNDIKGRSESSKPPALIYHDLNVVERVLRDQVTSDFSVIWVDTEPEYERVLRFFNRFQPALVKRVKLYTKETPLFEQFGLAEEMNKALKSKVWLKSGGYIVINQTEALVAIDINTGKYVGKTSRLEDTIVKTNVDAIKEIVRQIRLRDLGGIIIIDFIDMDERRNRQRVMQALEEELRHDRAPSKVLQFNDFGLVAITRKRVKQSLERTIGAPCPYCQSTGYVKSVTTVCNEIYVEMRKIAKHLQGEDVMLRVNPDVAKELKGNNGRLLNEMEELTKRTIIVKSDPALHQEQFDIN